MDWLKSKITIVVVCFLAVAGLQGYGLLSMRSTMEERFNSIDHDYATAGERMTVLSSDLDVIVKKLGVTEQELQDAQELAKQLKLENARVRRSLTAKADSKAVIEFQKEATTRIDTVHQEATTKIDGITGDVKGVRTDLDATRSDLKTTRSDLSATVQTLLRLAMKLPIAVATLAR